MKVLVKSKKDFPVTIMEENYTIPVGTFMMDEEKAKEYEEYVMIINSNIEKPKELKNTKSDLYQKEDDTNTDTSDKEEVKNEEKPNKFKFD